MIIPEQNYYIRLTDFIFIRINYKEKTSEVFETSEVFTVLPSNKHLLNTSAISASSAVKALPLTGQDASHAHAVHTGLHQPAGQACTVAQGVQISYAGLEMFIHHQTVGVEFHFHTVQ